MNNIYDKSNIDCTSCQVCASVCPLKAITIILSSKGFYKPVIDESVCTSCGLCKKSCIKYSNNSFIAPKNITCFSAVNKHQDILEKSSSGGIISAIYEYALENGYKCLGVVYNSSFHRAETIIIESKVDIDIARTSKYLPVFSEKTTSILLKSNDKWCIIATPCTLYGIKKSLEVSNKDLNNYIFVDFFCHGTPSQLLWNQQLAEINPNNSKISNVNFRSKKHGWHSFLLSYKLDGIEKYLKNALFYDLFFTNYLLNDSCAKCRIRDLSNIPDIRVGDFWGKKYDNCNEGISAVLCLSNKGKEILTAVIDKIFLQEENINDILPYQAINKVYYINESIRKRMFFTLINSQNLKTVIKIYTKSIPLRNKIFYYLKYFIRRIFCQKVQSKIRRIIH